jgi:hypothetical protein
MEEIQALVEELQAEIVPRRELSHRHQRIGSVWSGRSK